MNNLILNNPIELAEEEAYTNVVQSTIECFHKEMQMLTSGIYPDYEIFTEAKLPKSKNNDSNIIMRALRAIGRFFQWIGAGITRFINNVKNLFSKNKATSTPDQIMGELTSKTVTEAAVDIPSSKFSDYKMNVKVNVLFKVISCTVRSGKIYIKLNDVTKYGKVKNAAVLAKTASDAFDSLTDTPIGSFGKKIADNLHTKYTDMSQKMDNAMDVPGMSATPGLSSVIHIFSMIENPDMISILDDIIDKITSYCTNPKGFDDKVENDIRKLWKQYTRKASIKPQMLFNEYELTEFQQLESRINRIVKKQGQLMSPGNTAVNVPDRPDDIQANLKSMRYWLSTISAHIENLPMGFNLITNSIKNMWVVGAEFAQCISNPSQLAEFVERCIKAKIPPKYIAYNAWIVTTPDLNGYGTEFKPAWGQSRCVFFPKNKPNVVYKFALQYWGMRANKNEADITQLCEKEGCSNIIAKVVEVYKDHAMIACEKVTPFEDAKQKDSNDLANLIGTVKNACKEGSLSKYKINLTADLHQGNAGYKSSGELCMLDYGYTAKFHDALVEL